jgi:para-nitrobenzyl esterase
MVSPFAEVCAAFAAGHCKQEKESGMPDLSKRNIASELLFLVLLVLLRSAAFSETVKVEGGLLEGTVEDGLRVYRGIPYAAPPIGDLRWWPPQPAPKWERVRPADQFGRACIQTNAAIANLPAPSEDCLYLNVWTPAKNGADKLPVLVWIHGGGFVAGAPAEKLYHGEWLAKKGVVFVSIAYRLGVFGFLAHPELSAESPHHVSGNYGLLDMIAGLQWVRRNIAAFGGDPKRVTVQGESAGAAAVSILSASPLTKGLFRAAIAESGASFGPVRSDASFGESEPLANAEKRTVEWLSSIGVASVAELRKIPAEKLQTMIPHQFGWARPNMDGWVIAGDQYKLYEAGQYNDVPVLTGYNSDEGATFGSPKSQEAYVQSVRERYHQLADRILAAYPGGESPAKKWTAHNLTRDSAFGWNAWMWARLQTRTGKSKVFMYYFDEPAEIPAGAEPGAYGARHASELPYVFRQLTEHDRHAPTPKDEALSEMMRTYWTNFVKTGDPNGTGLPKWPAYTDSKPQVLHIESGNTKPGPLVNENGLDVLDGYFAGRRADEAKPTTH